jgi:hypothetical protein
MNRNIPAHFDETQTSVYEEHVGFIPHAKNTAFRTRLRRLRPPPGLRSEINFFTLSLRASCVNIFLVTRRRYNNTLRCTWPHEIFSGWTQRDEHYAIRKRVMRKKTTFMSQGSYRGDDDRIVLWLKRNGFFLFFFCIIHRKYIENLANCICRHVWVI